MVDRLAAGPPITVGAPVARPLFPGRRWPVQRWHRCDRPTAATPPGDSRCADGVASVICTPVPYRAEVAGRSGEQLPPLRRSVPDDRSPGRAIPAAGRRPTGDRPAADRRPAGRLSSERRRTATRMWSAGARSARGRHAVGTRQRCGAAAVPARSTRTVGAIAARKNGLRPRFGGDTRAGGACTDGTAENRWW